MKKIVLLICIAIIGISAYALTADKYATCTGSDNCKACKNCKYCKYCSKDNGKCGVCK